MARFVFLAPPPTARPGTAGALATITPTRSARWARPWAVVAAQAAARWFGRGTAKEVRR